MRNVYRISKCMYIDDLRGTGAATFAGRWHSKGTYILYTANSPSLALLESVVHMAGIPLVDYCMICLEIPDDKIMKTEIQDLPNNWYVNPAPGALGMVGDNFIKQNEHLAIEIPSAIMPEETNLLLNPNHTDFSKVKVVYRRKIPIDARFFSR
ncbi:MAG: RES family NAD+ phosphorylase [Chitinophagaceae bacterium]|nr:RES family NAD+ phosphorylase [Chitinophagaceae bacterium]